MPTPDPAHTLVSACHRRRSISSHWLATFMDFIRRRRLLVFGHIARLTQGVPTSSTQRPTLPSQPIIWSFNWWGPDWRRRPGRPRARWTDQLRNDTGSVPASLWRQTGHSTGPWWSDATARTDYAMTTTTGSVSRRQNRSLVHSTRNLQSTMHNQGGFTALPCKILSENQRALYAEALSWLTCQIFDIF